MQKISVTTIRLDSGDNLTLCWIFTVILYNPKSNVHNYSTYNSVAIFSMILLNFSDVMSTAYFENSLASWKQSSHRSRDRGCEVRGPARLAADALVVERSA